MSTHPCLGCSRPIRTRVAKPGRQRLRCSPCARKHKAAYDRAWWQLHPDYQRTRRSRLKDLVVSQFAGKTREPR